MPSPASVLFPAVTDSPAREFIAAQLQAAGCRTLVVPAAGRFAAAAAAVPVVGAGHIHAADTMLLPTLIGWLADPATGLDHLGVTVPQELQMFVAGAADPFQHAAGLMAAVKYSSLPRGSAFMAEQARAVKVSLPSLRSQLAAQLKAQADELRGLHYQIAPIEAALKGVDDKKTAIVIDFHGLKSQSRKAQLAAEGRFWDQPGDPFDPRETKTLLDGWTGAAALVIGYVAGEKQIPDGWVRLAATEGAGSTDYVIANRDPGGRLVKTRKRAGTGTTWPVYAEEEITPASEVGMVSVDKDTALHYRDLFVHRLAGTTVSEKYYLMLIDGRAVSVFGLHFRDQVVGKTPFCSETFGISVTSQRYERLGKLFMLCLTSRDMLPFLLHTSPTMLQRNPPIGVQTSSPTLRHEGKADRGVMRLTRRVPRKGGGFDLRYETEWRPEGWAEVVARWHREQAHLCRPGWDGPRLDPPVGSPNKKRRRGRRTDDTASGTPV